MRGLHLSTILNECRLRAGASALHRSIANERAGIINRGSNPIDPIDGCKI